MKLRSTLLLFSVVTVFLMFEANISAQSAPAQEPALVVNGIPVENAIKTIGGKTYIDINAVAKPLKISVQKTAGVVVLQTSGGSAGTANTTSIVGNLSYYFNQNYGNKPDVGSQIVLLEAVDEPIFLPTESVFVVGQELLVAKSKEEAKRYKILYSTAADGSGRFEFKGLDPKRYLLIATSSHSRGMTQAEILGKKLVRTVDLKPGETIDVSHDFGMTSY